MNLDLHATDASGLDAVFAGDTAEVRPWAGAKLRRDEGPAVFGTEDVVGIGTNVRHGRIQPSLRDSRHRKRQPGSELPGYCQISLRESGAIFQTIVGLEPGN